MSFEDQTNLPKAPPRSYVYNCVFVPRDDQKLPMIEGPKKPGTGDAIIRLDGYAIIPKDEYFRLKEIAGG